MLSIDGYGLLPVGRVGKTLLDAFDCGKPPLNAYLADSSTAMHQQRLGLTSVVFHENYPGPVGYFTLTNDSIPLKTSEVVDLGVEFALKAFPAVKIGRLAVSANLHGQGVGAAVMTLIVGEVLDSSSLSAARLLVVDSDSDPAVIRFYEKQGFELNLWAETQAKHHKGKGVQTVKMHRDILRT